jgi:hypothetical protein
LNSFWSAELLVRQLAAVGRILDLRGEVVAEIFGERLADRADFALRGERGADLIAGKDALGDGELVAGDGYWHDLLLWFVPLLGTIMIWRVYMNMSTCFYGSTPNTSRYDVRQFVNNDRAASMFNRPARTILHAMISSSSFFRASGHGWSWRFDELLLPPRQSGTI